LVYKFVTIVNNNYLSLKLVTIKSFLVVLTVQVSWLAMGFVITKYQVTGSSPM